MMRYARIEGGVAVEFLETEADITMLFPPELVWVPCGPQVQQGWLFDGSAFAPPAVAPFDPQGQPMTELRARRDRLLDVISGMQSDYITNNDMVNAGLCRDAKAQLKAAASNQTLLAATSREQFNAAAVALWKQIAATAPPDVRAEFARYATAA